MAIRIPCGEIAIVQYASVLRQRARRRSVRRQPLEQADEDVAASFATELQQQSLHRLLRPLLGGEACPFVMPALSAGGGCAQVALGLPQPRPDSLRPGRARLGDAGG